MLFKWVVDLVKPTEKATFVSFIGGDEHPTFLSPRQDLLEEDVLLASRDRKDLEADCAGFQQYAYHGQNKRYVIRRPPITLKLR